MRPLYEIAQEIKANWNRYESGTEMFFGAKPYVQAMASLDSIEDNYLLDSGRSVVAYFLSNAATWRGETARRIKAELRQMLKEKRP